jgi:hypothetical protein
LSGVKSVQPEPLQEAQVPRVVADGVQALLVLDLHQGAFPPRIRPLQPLEPFVLLAQIEEPNTNLPGTEASFLKVDLAFGRQPPHRLPVLLRIGDRKVRCELYEGEHEALIDRDTFSRVQSLLNEAGQPAKDPSRNPNYLLRGLLRCACCGSAFTAASTRKGKKEYRFYRCIRKDKQGREACPSSPLPAGAIEEYAIERLQEYAARGAGTGDATRSSWVERCLADFESIWDVLTPSNRGRLLRAVVQSIEVDEPASRVKVFLRDPGENPPKGQVEARQEVTV